MGSTLRMNRGDEESEEDQVKHEVLADGYLHCAQMDRWGRWINKDY